ncbi:hypothetical protein L249_2170 [Ophiocordyceps polyrhachis-furcata BCC 54312]|uniref:2'-phosphotransferase n=1 Tax=Ophiocordyceps polyrhachis-furcata BCC 54312 TaxID=1330021 RepID=A0A367LPE8_9HYPO|nr:hypothetical protein L249_2170 [Ophiocordyceps polyrhachis-furcata BCC 54312]
MVVVLGKCATLLQCLTSSSLRLSSRSARVIHSLSAHNFDTMPSSGEMEAKKRDIQISRALSRLLRHQAEKEGIKLDSEGFAPVNEVLVVSVGWKATDPGRTLPAKVAWGPLRSLGVTVDEIQRVVETNDKQRYGLKRTPSSSAYLIRANQGHSIKLGGSSSLLTPISLEANNVPARVLHGTYFAFWPAIEASGGLRPMGRNHVHCSTGDPDEDGGVVSGMRRDAELVVEIDVEASLRAGVGWWISENGVVLTAGDGDGVLSSGFFKSVWGRRRDVGVLWEDGSKKADLPDGIVAKVPKGKRRWERGPERLQE